MTPIPTCISHPFAAAVGPASTSGSSGDTIDPVSGRRPVCGGRPPGSVARPSSSAHRVVLGPEQRAGPFDTRGEARLTAVERPVYRVEASHRVTITHRISPARALGLHACAQDMVARADRARARPLRRTHRVHAGIGARALRLHALLG